MTSPLQSELILVSVQVAAVSKQQQSKWLLSEKLLSEKLLYVKLLTEKLLYVKLLSKLLLSAALQGEPPCNPHPLNSVVLWGVIQSYVLIATSFYAH